MTKFNTQQYKVQYTTVHNVQYATLFCYTRIPKLLKQICKVQVIKSNETKTHLPNTKALKLICKIYNKTIFCILQICFKTKLQNTKAIVIQAQNLDGFNWYFEILQNPSRSFKGILHQKIFYRLNLIFWIVMGCGIARFGRRGLKTTET